jgi:opacity protein-like surface antigen
MKLNAVIIMILFLTTSGLVHAELESVTQREGRWEYTLQTRYMTSSDYSGKGGSKLSIDDDLGMGFGFGYNINHQVNLGLNFTWRTVPYVATIVSGQDSQNALEYSNWLDTGSISMNGEYTITRSRIAPYVSGSLGWMAIDTNIYAGSDYACWWDPWWGYTCADYNYSFGEDVAVWSLGAGLRIELTPDAFLRVGYDHGWVDSDTFDGNHMFRVDIGFLD